MAPRYRRGRHSNRSTNGPSQHPIYQAAAASSGRQHPLPGFPFIPFIPTRRTDDTVSFRGFPASPPRGDGSV